MNLYMPLRFTIFSQISVSNNSCLETRRTQRTLLAPVISDFFFSDEYSFSKQGLKKILYLRFCTLTDG